MANIELRALEERITLCTVAGKLSALAPNLKLSRCIYMFLIFALGPANKTRLVFRHAATPPFRGKPKLTRGIIYSTLYESFEKNKRWTRILKEHHMARAHVEAKLRILSKLHRLYIISITLFLFKCTG